MLDIIRQFYSQIGISSNNICWLLHHQIGTWSTVTGNINLWVNISGFVKHKFAILIINKPDIFTEVHCVIYFTGNHMELQVYCNLYSPCTDGYQQLQLHSSSTILKQSIFVTILFKLSANLYHKQNSIHCRRLKSKHTKP